MSTRLIVKLAALASTCWLTISSAHAETRLALVIGNSSYTSVSALPNPANDAKAMANFLSSAGFRVTEAPNLTQGEMRRTIGNFASMVAEKDPIPSHWCSMPATACRSTARTIWFRSTHRSSVRPTCRCKPCASPI